MIDSILEGREIWTKSMHDFIRCVEDSVLSVEERFRIMESADETGVVYNFGRFMGACVASIEQPIMFSKTFSYSVTGFVKNYFD